MYSINSKGTAGNGRSLLKRFMGLFRNDSYDKLKTVINRLEEAKTKDSYYGSILNFIPNLVCAKDKRGVYTMVNQTFADFAGLDVSEIIGKTDKELNIYLNAEQVMEADRKMFDTKQKQFTPLEPFTNNYGELYWFQTVKTPVINHEGVVEEIVVTSVDVTKKVLEEQRLSKSELRYRSIFENNYSGIIAIDKELIIVNKNKAFDSLLGLKHVVGVQGDLKRYLQDEDRRELLDLVNGLSTRNYEFFDIDIPLFGVDGKQIETICFVRGLYDENNHFTEAVVTFQDVTFEKKQQKQLAESELRFRTLVENAPEAIMLLDLENEVYIDANAGAVKLLGHSKQELLSANIEVLGDPSAKGKFSMDKARGYMARAVDNESVVFDWRVKRKDGQQIDCEVRLVKMPYPDRVIIRVSILDISERKEAENLLSNEKQKLQQSNRELIDLNYKLGNQTRQLQEFAYIASHNLRAPAGNIRALLDFYHSDPSDETLGILLDKMDVVATNLMDTIDDLAQVVKIKNEVSKETTEIRLSSVMDKTLETLSQTIKELNAKVNIKYNAIDMIYAPKSYIESILLNLTTNALKYSSEERIPELDVEFKELEDKFVMSFKDNGLGIDMKRFGHKLFGLRKTFHRNRDSRGVGLFITKAQVEAMGGVIKVESEVDKGSMFSVELPLSTLNKPT